MHMHGLQDHISNASSLNKKLTNLLILVGFFSSEIDPLLKEDIYYQYRNPDKTVKNKLSSFK